MKYTAFIFCLLLTIQTFAQRLETDSTQMVKSEYDFYLQKAKNQRTVAWCLLGGGFGLFLVGTAQMGKAYTGNGGTESANSGAVMMTLGVLAPLASIPVFIAAGKNKNRANAAMYVKPAVSFLPPSQKMQPSLGLNFPIQKKIPSSHKYIY